MTRDESARFLKSVKTTWPNKFAKMPREEREAMLDIWHKSLERFSLDQCLEALAKHVKQCEYLPDIREIIDLLPTPAVDKYQNDWQRRSDKQLQDWYAEHVAELHAAGKMSAVECKEAGLSYADYCAQFGEVSA